MAKSIGSLYIDVLAKVDNLEKDMERAKKIIGETGESMRKSGNEAAAAYKSFSLFNSFQGRGMLGIVGDMTALTMAVQAAKKEFMWMYDNIDKIPGINPQAVASINEFKVNLLAAREASAQFLAEWFGKALDFSKAVGAGAAMWFSGNPGDDSAIKAELESVDKLKAANDPAYWDKVLQKRQQLAMAAKDEAVASKVTSSERIAELNAQAEVYERFAAAASTSTLDRLGAEAEASKRRKAALNLEKEINDKYEGAKLKSTAEYQKSQMAEMNQLDRILTLRQLIHDQELAQLATAKQVSDKGGVLGMSNEDKERFAKGAEVMRGWTAELRAELKKVKEPWQEFNDSFKQGFQQLDDYLTSFVTGGTLKLNTFLLNLTNAMISSFARLAIINPILNGMFGGGVGGALMPALYGAGATKGRASGGPGSGLTWVGENGPELVNLPGGSYVNDAQRSRGMAGGGNGGNTYIIDARGADAAAAERIERTLLQLAGPGVVEQRALAATANAKMRRQSSI